MKKLLLTACLLAAVSPMAHASSVHADKLPRPKTMTCLQVKPALSYNVVRGWLHIPWQIQLGQGGYVSEREDANGVYYRAPTGSITERRTDQKPGARAGRPMSFEGGIYVPDDAAAAPTLYMYYGTATMEQLPEGDTECSRLAYTVDPATHDVNVVGTAMAIGIGAGLGAAIGRFINPRVHMSYGQAAGAGLVGGVIGGLIIAAIEKSKSGELLPGPTLDAQTSASIRMLAANKLLLQQLGRASGATMAAAAEPSTAAPVVMASSGAMAVPAHTTDANASMPVATAPAVATATMADAALTSKAQGVADQLRCGEVKPDGEGFVAACGSYGVYISCDAGQCRPQHTVKF